MAAARGLRCWGRHTVGLQKSLLNWPRHGPHGPRGLKATQRQSRSVDSAERQCAPQRSVRDAQRQTAQLRTGRSGKKHRSKARSPGPVLTSICSSKDNPTWPLRIWTCPLAKALLHGHVASQSLSAQQAGCLPSLGPWLMSAKSEPVFPSSHPCVSLGVWPPPDPGLQQFNTESHLFCPREDRSPLASHMNDTGHEEGHQGSRLRACHRG